MSQRCARLRSGHADSSAALAPKSTGRGIIAVFWAASISAGVLVVIVGFPLFVQLNPAIRQWARRQDPWLSAAPLLLAGLGLVGAQWILKPRLIPLLKRLMLSAAFILWGIVQLMPATDLAVELGNVVIALYVVDLALIMGDELRASSRGSARDHPAIHRHADGRDV